MKKIYFSNKYGLNQAVLDGRKTMTRRIFNLCEKDLKFIRKTDKDEFLFSSGTVLDSVTPNFKMGEVVAVAMSYRSIIDAAKHDDYVRRFLVARELMLEDGAVLTDLCTSAGYDNKIFVKADFMPYRIHITNIKAERLQDISDEDAMCEGVFKYDKPPLHHEGDHFAPWPPYVKPYKHDCDNLKYLCSARWAFAYLIDKVCGKGTWDSNPWVFAYEFQLLKY